MLLVEQIKHIFLLQNHSLCDTTTKFAVNVAHELLNEERSISKNFNIILQKQFH